jgi:hypothetical protein
MPEVNFEVNRECLTKEKGDFYKTTLWMYSRKKVILPCMDGLHVPDKGWTLWMLSRIQWKKNPRKNRGVPGSRQTDP